MKKSDIPTIARKNAIVDNIIDAIVHRDNFLVLGHQNPDEDCIASMIAIALLLTKFSKKVRLFASDQLHEHFGYLLNICKYNSIGIARTSRQVGVGVDTIFICDTPKPSMVSYSDEIAAMFHRDDIIRIEIDHHLQADSEYIGDPDYSLVTEASSASELVGFIALKLQNRPELLQKHQVVDLLSRNFVLAVLTGIIGDTKMGKYIKSSKERRFYEIFSSLFNELLLRKTSKGSNFSNKDEVFREIHRLSTREEECFHYMMDRKRFSESVGYTILGKAEMQHLESKYDRDTIISVARATADALAEESGILSLVVYYDAANGHDLVQFRARRSQEFKKLDLRVILDIFHIENGGGHQGAIGFRLDASQVTDIDEYVDKLISGIELALAAVIPEETGPAS
jgi:nanoRNase/pAp phosphatase (c-di-AMP/oligoRNAs hydrolase)